MSIEAILEHILNEAGSQKEEIISRAKKERQEILRQTQAQAEQLYEELVGQGRHVLEGQKEKALVSARLGAKKKLLETKQNLIDAVFEKIKSQIAQDKIKKQCVLKDKVQETHAELGLYLEQLRLEYEIELAKILFSP